MLFTKATEYALLSVIYLAQTKEPKDVDTISKQLNISKSFLAKILQNLAKDEILVSYKGTKGGFKFCKDPAALSVNEIIKSVERKPTTIFECSNSEQDCPNNIGKLCKIWKIFNTLQNQVDGFLNELTLEDILKIENN